MYGCECENDLSLLVDESQVDTLTNLEQLQLLVEVCRSILFTTLINIKCNTDKGQAFLIAPLILSTLLYSTELWPLTVTLSKKLEAAHHRWLRGLLGITWRDKVTNEEIQKRTGQTLLKKMIRERRLRCLGHVTRMDEVRFLEQALQWAVAGFKRRPGRPRIHWRDIMNKDLQRMGLTWEEFEASAQDRQTWHQRVALCIADAR